MWHIANPHKIFDYIYEYDESEDFQLMALMRKEKYDSMPLEDRNILEKLNEVKVLDIKIKNPNNPVKLIEARLLIFKI